MDLDESKRAVRAHVLDVLRRMPPTRRAMQEEVVTAGIQQEPEWKAARRVLLYRSTGHEMGTVGLANAAWRQGKEVAFPRMAFNVLEIVPCSGWGDLEKGRFGIEEPRAGLPAVPPSWVDLALVPGVAFTTDGHRVGRGGGHYDRFLPLLSCPAWGLAFDEQVVGDLPKGPHDALLARVVAAKTYV